MYRSPLFARYVRLSASLFLATPRGRALASRQHPYGHEGRR